LRFLPSKLGRGYVAYFVCPISKDNCRKLYLYKNHFTGRKGIKRAYYSSEVVSGKKRQNLKYIARLNKNTAITNASQQPYFMPFYNGCATKRYYKLLRADQMLKASL
jgi:hypothetical protein